MRRVLDFMMNNKYFIIVFAVVVFGFKLLLDNYNWPNNYLPIFTTLRTVFLTVFVTSIVHVISFFVFALVTRNKSEHWWEHLENRSKAVKKVDLLKTYTQGLIVSIPLAVYGTLVYFAVFQPWKSILTFALAFAITRIITYFQNNIKQRSQRDL
jgi:uncharacterized protein YacL